MLYPRVIYIVNTVPITSYLIQIQWYILYPHVKPVSQYCHVIQPNLDVSHSDLKVLGRRSAWLLLLLVPAAGAAGASC